jgi:hypothetical protein
MIGNRRLLILTMIAGILILVRGVLTPIIEFQNGRIEIIQSLTLQLEKGRQRIASSPEIEKYLAKIEPALLTARNEIFLGESAELVKEQQEIEQLFERHDMVIKSFQWSAERLLPNGLVTVNAQLTLEGNFYDFLELTLAIARRQPFTNLKDLRLRNVYKKGSQNLDGTVTMEIIRSYRGGEK